MKTARFTAILLVLVLLLCGCNMDIAATPTPTPTPTPSPTPEPVIDDEGNVVEPPPEAQYDGPAVVVISGAEDSPFGLVQDMYYMENNPSAITFGEVVGDTDKLNPTGIRITDDSIMYNEMEFVFDAAFPIAFTAEQYTNGEVVSDGGIPAKNTDGYVERYGEDGSWTRTTISQVRTPVPWVIPATGKTISGETPPDTGESEIPTLKDDAVRVMLPLTEPGVYRYTLYFRESIDHTEESFTTGEELYQLSMIVIIPMSDKDYDLLAISDITTYSGNDTAAYETGISFGLMFRTNNIEDKWEASSRAPAYNMTRAGMLERKEGDEWVELEDAVQKYEPTEIGDMRSGGASSENYFIANNFTTGISVPELAGEYRLTLAYIDDYDTDYDLVLHFNFDE